MMNKSKWILSVLLVFCLVFSLAGTSLAREDSKSGKARGGMTFDFKDSEDALWAQENIGKMQVKNVIKGYGDGTYRPNTPVKRIEAIVMAIRLMELEEEALAKSDDTQLHFKDADKIPDWAIGHVIVALEKGLFDLSDDKIQPDKPATRLWIVSLLVRALNLQTEALSQMTDIPDFKDAHKIPAGSIGYVNVAIQDGLLNGYDDNTFRPNRSVTRGEMAAFLDRTNDGLLEQSGAIIVQGMITEIAFGDTSVTGDVYTNGVVTVQSFGGNTDTYFISSEKLVQYYEKFIRADQLLPGDLVTLVVQDRIVLEANLLDQDKVITQTNLIELKIEAELNHDGKIELKYKNKRGKVEGKIEFEANDDEKIETKGNEAIAQLEAWIEEMSLSSDMTKEEIVQAVLTVLQINADTIEELEIEIKFSNGEKVEIEIEDDDDDEDEDEHDNDHDDDN
jgi:hypothetical protein